MILSNVEDFTRITFGINGHRFQATVEVTKVTGRLWWKTKSTTRRGVASIYGNSSWFFTDDGQLTPAYQMEALARAQINKAGWFDKP